MGSAPGDEASGPTSQPPGTMPEAGASSGSMTNESVRSNGPAFACTGGSLATSGTSMPSMKITGSIFAINVSSGGTPGTKPGRMLNVQPGVAVQQAGFAMSSFAQMLTRPLFTTVGTKRFGSPANARAANSPTSKSGSPSW